MHAFVQSHIYMYQGQSSVFKDFNNLDEVQSSCMSQGLASEIDMAIKKQCSYMLWTTVVATGAIRTLLKLELKHVPMFGVCVCMTS